jgi:diguanylate cyclase (GGDEF)-like protein
MTSAVDGNESLLQFLYSAPIGLLQTAIDGAVEIINPMSAQLLMPVTPTGELDNLYEILGTAVPHLRSLVESFGAEHGVVCEALRFGVDGHRDGERTYAISVMKMDALRLMVVVADASSQTRREQAVLDEQLHHAARVDELTRMPNRVALAESMHSVWTHPDGAGGLHVAVLLVGCERLNEIGASFGDSVKNRVLTLMARRLRSALRPGDGLGRADEVDPIAARTGSDEFVVLLQLSNGGDVTLVAQRVLDALGKPYAVEPHSLHCGVSVGILHRPAEGADVDDAFRDAAIAMREAKRVGGSRWVVFEPGMRERAVRRGSIEMDLRRALVNDELFVVYQPIVSLQHGSQARAVAGVEALVRWRHPTRGIVPPIEFIGVAEETGLINALGSFVLYAACRQFVAWSDAMGDRAPALLAVNLSRAQLGDPALVELVRTTLVATGMSADRLQLEVTESLAAQDDAVQSQLHALKDVGIQIALDDFGTGYSSLSSLHLLPVDTVKIDRSFVTLAESSPHHRVLIEATIRVAKSLGMKTVAEGIETDGQDEIVRTLGCDKGQGYRYSRPIGAELVPAWIAAMR